MGSSASVLAVSSTECQYRAAAGSNVAIMRQNWSSHDMPWNTIASLAGERDCCLARDSETRALERCCTMLSLN